MAAPIETGSRTTSGAYSLAVPAWASVIDYFLLGGGKGGSDGTNYGPGSKGDDGKFVSGSVRVKPGSSLSCSIAGASAETTINLGGTVFTSGTGTTKPTNNTLSRSTLVEGDPAVASPWSVSVGSRGDGGAGGSRGYTTTDPPTPPGEGEPGTGGGLYWRFRQAAQIPRIGNIPAVDVKSGTKQVQAIYIGTKKVWDKSAN
ncbi:hypothetical protein SEA_BEAVER_31 [Gordonia phage Beaver]|uniref:Glycine-rich domain-containing protein n=1 Tax=Gordonia phage Beaver TaxID=2591111 RepID=A0A515MJJ6_9CAUD|nr:minor tail protein [Gordonia phage Beaver]QDM56845.1 hypothetical protein SEA_BEAVER_31 [Gordonia phage Beaver]